MARKRAPESGPSPRDEPQPGSSGEVARTPYLWAVFSAQPGKGLPESRALRALFTRKGYGTKNALVVADIWFAGKETDSKHAAALFRVRNTTNAAIDWPVHAFMTAFSSIGEPRSIIVNQVPVLVDEGDFAASDCARSTVLSIPADTDSTVTFSAASGPDYGLSSSLPLSARSLCLGFFNDCLDLPSGLEYVDDLKVASEESAREHH